MKRVFSIIFVVFILVSCSSNGNSHNSEKVDVNEINIEESDKNSNEALPFDVEAFKKNYYDEYESFKVEYEKEFDEELEQESSPKANLTFEETSLLFKDGILSEAVVFLSVLNDMVDGDDEINDLATEFIEKMVNDESYASKTITNGLEIKIGAVDQENISIGIYEASEDDL